MKRLLIAAAVSAAALANAACVTVIGVDDDYDWHGENAQPFDGARSDCRARVGHNEGSTAFVQCMAEKGWTRDKD
jgi:predicted small secreted protein